MKLIGGTKAENDLGTAVSVLAVVTLLPDPLSFVDGELDIVFGCTPARI